ncbi:DUF6628 family protein [Sphingomonas canadensis]|uniref:DUF6628 family protein n=1 Tax=Sphingomonas canadensis TaxID=1219257 RepID=A0ABW3HDH7_9SPHN|nr:DUF6628 family protein [Sphingomonas canadensis]MCW3837945.1 hypothetical protein [Sphingomonas canadensis]
MQSTATLAAALPAMQPEDPGARLMLFAMRQMGMHGIHDACAAHAFVVAFGKNFRRPLVLLRALMTEMATVSQRPIPIAPWCCPRMTRAEETLLAVLARAGSNPEAAHLLLRDLCGVRDCASLAFTAGAVARAFADQGLPLDLTGA